MIYVTSGRNRQRQTASSSFPNSTIPGFQSQMQKYDNVKELLSHTFNIKSRFRLLQPNFALFYHLSRPAIPVTQVLDIETYD